MTDCFICENKNCTSEESKVCDLHKLLVCSHGLTKQYMCSGAQNEKCISLCIVNGCNKNKHYFVDGEFRGTIFSGTYVTCNDHIGKCECGNTVSNIGERSKCIGCMIEPRFNYDTKTGDITIMKKSDYPEDKQPITLLFLLMLFNRRNLDKNCVSNILEYLEFV